MAEKEYIEREAASRESVSVYTKAFGSIEVVPLDAIASIPAADARPVVWCRDCQDSYKWKNAQGDSYRYCVYLRSRWNHDADRMVDDDDFCKWGRKREES